VLRLEGTLPSFFMPEIISLVNAAKFYRALPTQNKAWDYLTSLLTQQELAQFAALYRESAAAAQVTEQRYLVEPMVLLSQRDYKGDNDKDGKLDLYQTCNVHSVAMVINHYYPKKVSPLTIDSYIRDRKGSRYSHASLVDAMSYFGVKSTFSTTTKIEAVLACLKAGKPVIWSNKLTMGGHIVVLAGYDAAKKAIKIFDPWGEPSRVNGKWVYKPSNQPYWLSLASFNASGMNGNSTGHWAHLTSI
jgi:hypothetical protein